jgi:hypothetical protein
MPFARGARPSPRHRLAAASPHRIVGVTPPQFLWRPARISMWCNATYECCVTTEEAFKDACNSPEIFIPDDTVRDWATQNGVLNGADLSQVLDLMLHAGFPLNGQLFNDGPASSVDWTNAAVLQNAISQGPVKIGIAADQLEGVVPDPPTNGWIATGFTADANEDHCVSLCGYGTADWLASQLGVTVPSALKSVLAYAMFTWNSIGIIDVPSLLAICGEAWLRTPSTVVVDGPDTTSLYGG